MRAIYAFLERCALDRDDRISPGLKREAALLIQEIAEGPKLPLKEQAIQAINALNADDSVTRDEMRDHLADVSNHIDDLMRAIDAEAQHRRLSR